MVPKILLIVMALLLSVAVNLFQYSYFGEKVDDLKADKAEQAAFYNDVIMSQSQAISMLEKQATVERQVSLDNRTKLEAIQKATQATASQLDLLGSNNEDIQDWYDAPVPPDVIQLLNNSANQRESDGGEALLSTWRIPKGNTDSYLANYIRQNTH